MDLHEYQQTLKAVIKDAGITCPLGTPYNNLGEQMMMMIISYISDAEYFSKQQDYVNQFVSLSYVHGWLSSGIFLGILYGKQIEFEPDGFKFIEIFNLDHLNEKTERYSIMLKKALKVVKPSPVAGSPVRKAAEICLATAKKELSRAEAQIQYGQRINALGLLSYGYGWLDSAVRAGLINVSGDQYLFTTEI